jgi:hypothetical protein
MARPTSGATYGKDVAISGAPSRPSSQAANNEESLRKRRKPKARYFKILENKKILCTLYKAEIEKQ